MRQVAGQLGVVTVVRFVAGSGEALVLTVAVRSLFLTLCLLSVESDDEVEVVRVGSQPPRPPPRLRVALQEGTWENPGGDGWCGPACCAWICQRVGPGKTQDGVAEETGLVKKNQWMTSSDLKKWVEAQAAVFAVKEYSSEESPGVRLRSRKSWVEVQPAGVAAAYTSQGGKSQGADVPSFGVVNASGKHWWVFEGAPQL